MDESWIFTTVAAATMVLLSAVGIYISVIALTRLFGLRSFSKMSSFDFAMTVAIGSTIAGSLLTKNPPLIQAIVALAAIYLLQMIVARLRVAVPWMSRVVDNQPLLLMANGEILQGNLEKARVTQDDLWVQLREANVLSLEQVEAVVMETTGDITVLVRNEGGPALDPVLLRNVREREQFSPRE